MRAVRLARGAAVAVPAQQVRQRLERQVLGADRARSGARRPPARSARQQREAGRRVEHDDVELRDSGRITSARRRSGCRTLRSATSIRASAGEPVIRCRLGMPATAPDRVGRPALVQQQLGDRRARRPPGGRRARSRRSCRPRGRPAAPTARRRARTVAMLTAVVVLPTPPLGLKAAMIIESSATARRRAVADLIPHYRLTLIS